MPNLVLGATVKPTFLGKRKVLHGVAAVGSIALSEGDRTSTEYLGILQQESEEILLPKTNCTFVQSLTSSVKMQNPQIYLRKIGLICRSNPKLLPELNFGN